MKYVLGLGANLGDPLRSLRAALKALGWGGSNHSVQPLAVSPIYESEAMLPAGAPVARASAQWSLPYLNLALLCDSLFSPDEMLAHLKEIERALGRQQRDRWAPREIDIDILVWEGSVFESAALQVPHSGLLERPFALLPLADLAPHWVDATQRRTYGELSCKWRFLPADEVPYRTRRSRLSLVRLAGILNLTPDSFSDGGKEGTAAELVTAGAEILDLGAESTRPGATLITWEEEWARLEGPLRATLLERDQKQWRARIAVDTRHFETAQKALTLGADCINDVSGLKDRRMAELLAGSRAQVVVMHSLSVPPTRQAVLPLDADPVEIVGDWALNKLDQLGRIGIPRERIAIDPGIGFGKSSVQNWELIRRVGELQTLGCEIYIGHSRKGFLALASDRPASERDIESAVLTVEAARRGTLIIRVHDVAINARALATEAQLDGVIRL